MHESPQTRRRFLASTAAIAGTTLLAGCSSGGGDGDDGDDGDGGDDGGTGGDSDVPSRIDDYLSGANQYDGTIVDETGASEVVVDVGTGSNGTAYDPPAIRVDAGTTVRWEWTGDGGGHDVTADSNSDFDFSSDLKTSEGATFEQQFDSAGIALYYCTPHEVSGMLGAVEVV